MARVYDVAVASLALDVDRKWLDNLTAQHSIPGTEHFARGVPRRLSMRALETAALVRDLNRALGVPVARGVAVAAAVLGDPDIGQSTGHTRLGAAITLSVDLPALERDIEARLLVAMETAIPRRRGRPPRKERRGTR